MRNQHLCGDRSQDADLSGTYCRDAFDRIDRAYLAVFGQPGEFCPDDRLHQGCVVGNRTERYVLPRGLRMFPEAPAFVDRALCKLCRLARRGILSSMAAAVGR